MVLFLVREHQTQEATMGRLFVGTKHFCFTLENPVRPSGVKVNGRTAIPEGVYAFEVTRSPKFGRDMIILYNKPDRVTLENGGISFKGIRIHGGNHVEDSNGCPLVAFHRSLKDKVIWSTASHKLLYLVMRGGGKGLIVVTSDTNAFSLYLNK